MTKTVATKRDGWPRLPCPETCPLCHVRADLIDSRLRVGFRRRRYRCGRCKRKWNTYETVLNVKNFRLR